MRGVRPGCLLLLALALGGCLLPTRFAIAPCRSGKRREGRVAVLPADITVFTSPAKRAAVKRAGLAGRVAQVVDGIREKGHRVVAAIDVGGRISAVGRGESKSRVHPEDVRTLRIALYHQAERMVQRRAATSQPPLAVDPQLARAVARPSRADALLYLYVTAYSQPAAARRVTAGNVARAVAQYVAAIGASIAVGALIGGLSVKLTPSSIRVDWSSKNLSGKRVPLPDGAPRLPGTSGVLGPVLIAHTTTPLMDRVPCHSCGPGPASRATGEVDPESREPVFVGDVRRVDGSFIEATLVAASARDGRLLWVSRWLDEGDIADRDTGQRLFEHIVKQVPRCGMKLTDWDNFRD